MTTASTISAGTKDVIVQRSCAVRLVVPEFWCWPLRVSGSHLIPCIEILGDLRVQMEGPGGPGPVSMSKVLYAPCKQKLPICSQATAAVVALPRPFLSFFGGD